MSVRHVFYLNLDRCPERNQYYQNLTLPKSYAGARLVRWPAIDGHQLSEEACQPMISMWTIRPEHHRAKMGCYLSHCAVLRHLVEHQLDRVLILEDDAELREVEVPSEVASLTGVCFFGGWATSRKVCDQGNPLDFLPPESPSAPSQIHRIPEDAPYRILQSRAYYLPTAQVAADLLTWLESHHRVRAYDIMLCRFPQTRFFMYPALVTNRLGEVSSRDGRTRNCQDLLCYR